MSKLLESLRIKGRNQLANILEKRGSMPVAEYSAALYDYQSPCALEPELYQAFCQELQRLGYSQTLLVSIMAHLEQKRILQTATHLTASEGATFFALHWLATLGLSSENPYLVGAFSGVPFSNSAWSGCLNYSNRHALDHLISPQSPVYSNLLRAEKDRGRDTKERRLSLIPSSQRDALVFRSLVSEQTPLILRDLLPELKSLFPEIDTGNSYSLWALQSCQRVSTRLFRQKVVYFDLNEVISSYLQLVFTKSGHPLYQFFFDNSFQKRVLAEFDKDLPLFTTSYQEKEKEKWSVLKLNGQHLESPQQRFAVTPDSLGEALGTGKLCPGVFLTFTILSFLNGFKCLGSFEQVEYLAEFQEKWLRLGLLEEQVVRNSPTDGLTTGRFVDAERQPVFPLDIVLGTSWEFPEGICVQDLIEPLFPQLLQMK